MVFKGRTVLAFVILAILASSVVTVLLLDSGSGFTSLLGNRGQWGGYADSPLPSHAAKNGPADDGLSEAELKKIDTAYRLIAEKYYLPVDREKVVDGAIHGMLSALDDPYSAYMNKEEAKRYEENVDAYFTGIGAEVMLENGNVTVVSPIKGSPAEKAGIQAKDVIISVNGEKLEGLKLSDAVAKIRGPKGTQAKLEIMRPGRTDRIEVIVVRDEIDIETVFAQMLPGGYGDIVISQFSGNTVERFQEELDNLEKKGMEGLIIDVRNNPGGYLLGVLEIIEPLVPKGKTLVQVEDASGDIKKTVSKGEGKNYPIVVLTNEGSASASEILAGALSQSAGATLVGEKTFGKGTVQTTYTKEFQDGSELKLTIAKWLTPDGTWVHGKGIAPDIAVSQPDYFKATPIDRSTAIKRDQNGDAVKNLQLILSGVGFDPGRKDGYFDEKTEAAVKKFQQKLGLPADGVVDEKTADALEQAIIKVVRDPKNDRQLQKAIETLQRETSGQPVSFTGISTFVQDFKLKLSNVG
ncbi:MAG TPA: S41 family peptidase [Bacilli bacterium]